MPKKLLLVGSQGDSSWVQMVQGALTPLGELYLVSEDEALTQLRSRDYDLILIDATYLDDVTNLIAALSAEKDSIPIVVLSIVATWQQVRSILIAGATDYIQKSLDPDPLFKALSEILSRPKIN